MEMSQNWEEICRLCASHSELNQTSQELSQIILKHLSIMIKNDDGLSTKICNKCEEKVIEFHNFSMECERIQSMFVDYKNVNTSNPDFGFECSVDIKVKEESNYGEIESRESFNEFAEAIEVNNLKKVHARNKRKSLCTKKEEIYMLKYDCHICKLEFSNWKVLSLHTKKEHKTKPQIKCLCDKMLFNIRSVLDHEKKHNPAKCLKCNSCSQTFSMKSKLIAHEYTHLPKTDKPFVCDECFKRFTSTSSLRKHKLNFHNLSSEPPKWLCELCDAKLSTKSGLELHVKFVHEKLKPFMCDLCGHTFGLKSNLIEHRSIHSSEMNFVCDKCDKKFKTKRSLLIHIDSHADTAYQCPHCPMLLNSRTTLRSHLCVHSDVINFNCSVCGRGFKRKKNLMVHMKLHTGERPHKCAWCPQTFSIKGNYKLHKMKHHPVEFQREIKDDCCTPVLDGINDVPKKIIHLTMKSDSASLSLNNTKKTNDKIRKKKQDSGVIV